METFFNRLKVEPIYDEWHESISVVKSGIFECIEVFYNRLQTHSAVGYVSPAKYERNTVITV